MIEEYHFGAITIDGEIYSHDIEIRWNDEILDWQRDQSHVIDIEDVARAVEQGPETIIIGIGESGSAQVTEEAQQAIKSRGIELIIDPTEQAIKTFNILKEESEEEKGKQEKVIGLFHLTS